MSAKGRQKKGQFFIIGAIIIITVLYMLSNSLTQSTNIDSASVQDNTPAWMLEETEKGLYHIAKKNLTNAYDIDEFIKTQKEIAQESGFSLELFLNFTPYSAGPPRATLYTMSLQSNDYYIMKENQLLPYYGYCEGTADDPFLCWALDFTGDYALACCKAYRICC